jgi:hypothetical protein
MALWWGRWATPGRRHSTYAAKWIKGDQDEREMQGLEKWWRSAVVGD